MQKLIFTLFVGITLMISNATFSQCNPDESTVQIIIDTDNWGEELYWELVPQGQSCGDAPVLLSGGNMNVGCDGNGTGASYGNTYASNEIFVSDMICATTDSQLDLIHVDSYGDGGCDFIVLIDGYQTAYLDGTGFGNVFTIDVVGPDLIAHDSPCDAADVATDGTPTVISSIGATSGYFEMGVPALGCNVPGGWCEGEASVSVWAKFIAEEGVSYKISTCNAETDFDTQLAAWSVDDCGDWNTYSLVASNDDIACGNGAYYSSTCYTSCFAAGTEVYIQIDGWFGSTGIAELTVEPSEVETDISASVHNISCALESDFNPDGYIHVYSYYGGLNWDASWTGPFGYTGTGMSIYGLLPGVYNVEIVSNCTGEVYSASYTITNPDEIELDITVSSSCENGSGGSLDLDIIGGTGEMDIDWDGPKGFDWDGEDILSAESGWYSVEVTDANGCSESIEIEVPFVGIAPFSLGPDFEMCAGDNEFFFGPVGNYNYEWQDGSNGQFFILETEPDVSTTAVVGVSVSNAFGCESSDAVVITIINCDLSASDLNGTGEWSFAPNPVAESAVMLLDGVTEGSICNVRDARGRLIQTFYATARTHFDASRLETGVYMIDVEDENGLSIWHSRIVVQ
jgi:hypothetical protein